jgi:hypothetical protein
MRLGQGFGTREPVGSTAAAQRLDRERPENAGSHPNRSDFNQRGSGDLDAGRIAPANVALEDLDPRSYVDVAAIAATIILRRCAVCLASHRSYQLRRSASVDARFALRHYAAVMKKRRYA